MMATDTEQLVVSLEARIRDFERNFQRANRTASSNFKAIEGQAKRSADTLEASMSRASKGVNVAMAAFKGGIAGLAAGLSVGALQGIAARAGDIARSVASVGNEAKRAGLSSKAFQELGYVAQQNRIPVDALVDGMKELNLRADEFIITGGGSAAEAFQRLGYGAQDLKRKLQDPSALLVEIIGKLEQLDRAAQIRVADELFGGTGGERFVELLDSGAAGVRALIKEATELGVVLDDDVIARADELDRKFNQIGTTISTNVKQAVVGLVGAMDDFLDRFNDVEEQSTRNVQGRLLDVYSDIAAEKQKLADLQQISMGTPADVMNITASQKEVERLTAEAIRLRDILDRRAGYNEDFIYKTGQDAKQTTPSLENLYGALDSTGSSATEGAKGLDSFAKAVRSLKDEIPGLSGSLAALDARTRIDQTYKAALSKARTMGEVHLANELRGNALKAVGVKSATDDPTHYLSNVLASGKSKQHVTGLSATFAEKLSKMMASMPDDLKGGVTINSGFRSVERQAELWQQALAKYGSPEAARKWVAPPGKSQHNKGNAADLGYSSDAARNWMHQNAGNYGLTFPLSNEDWHIEDADARGQMNAEVFQQQATAMQQQADAYQQIIGGAQHYIAVQDTEQQVLGMTAQQAAALRYEQQMLAQAQQAGIALTPTQTTQIQQLANGMASAEVATANLANSQQSAAATANFFAQQSADAIGGLLSGTMSAEDALQKLIGSLAQAALQAALLGTGPLAGIMGGGSGGGSGGGLLGGFFSALLGAKDGGFITPNGVRHFASGGNVRGPGTSRSDSIPAMLSDGEYVVNAAATKKNRAALEAINRGKIVAPVASVAGGKTIVSRTVHQVSNHFSPTIPITVQASGNAKADTAMREALGNEMDTLMENKMTEFFHEQSRSGNLANRKGFV